MGNKKIFSFILILWIIISILTYGISLAHWQGYRTINVNKYCRRDAGFSILFSILSPITLPIMYLLSGFAEHGLQFKCESAENR